MVNTIGSLVLRRDLLRRALNRALQKLPRGVAIPLELWSDDLTYGRLIEAAERAGDRREVECLCGEASMDRSLLEDERLERESLKLQANARRHLIAIPHYDGHEDNQYWEQSPRNGRVHLTIVGVAEVGLIRFGGHLPRGEYDVDHDGHAGQADAAELHG